MLLGAEASRRSDKWSEDPFSATLELLRPFQGGLPLTRAGLSRSLSQVECWAHCLAPALGRLHL